MGYVPLGATLEKLRGPRASMARSGSSLPPSGATGRERKMRPGGHTWWVGGCVCRAKWCCFFLGSCACWAEVSGDLRASPRRPLALASALPAARRRGGEFCALRRAALSPSPSPPPGEAASSAKVGHVTSTLSLSEPGSRILGPCALARSPAPLAENRHRRYVPRSAGHDSQLCRGAS